MSAWERARYIPWDRIPQGSGENLEAQREKIFRDLQKETIQDELQSNDRKQPAVAAAATAGPSGSGLLSDTGNNDIDNIAAGNVVASNQQSQQIQKSIFETKVPYSSMVLLRQAAFGGCIGSITGAVFGFMDGMRTVGESSILKNASNTAKGRYLMQGTTRSATIFGVFFGGFHITKYGVRVIADPGEVAEIGIAGVVSIGALMYKPMWRASMPYAVMLIFMDGVSFAMRSHS